jgi:anti-sigma factor RsiW
VSHVSAQLTAYLDRALDDRARDAVEAHLAACSDCRAHRDRIAQALVALRRLPPAPEPSPHFEPHFYARLARQPSRRFFPAHLRWRLWAPTAAVVLGAALVAGLELRHRHRQELAARHLDLLQGYEMVASVGDVDDADVALVAHLHELRSP